MQLTIKTRMIINGVLSVTISIVLAMVIIFVPFNRQNKENAHNRIDQARKVISGQYEDLKTDLMAKGENIGRQDILINQMVVINDFLEMGEDIKLSVFELSKTLSDQVQALNLQQAVLYTKNGLWLLIRQSNSRLCISNFRVSKISFNPVR